MLLPRPCKPATPSTDNQELLPLTSCLSPLLLYRPHVPAEPPRLPQTFSFDLGYGTYTARALFSVPP
jgi:hypothetical protein